VVFVIGTNAFLNTGEIGTKMFIAQFYKNCSMMFSEVDFRVRAPSSHEILAKQMQTCKTLISSKIFYSQSLNWRRGRPKKERALSASENIMEQFLRKANLPLDSKVVVCGICQQPGHNRRTCPRMQNFLADRAGVDMIEEFNWSVLHKYRGWYIFVK
jgi:hypothetical protein